MLFPQDDETMEAFAFTKEESRDIFNNVHLFLAADGKMFGTLTA